MRSGLLVLPGIVDLHGDAFERQMMPRPGVDFPIDVALIDSDRQAIANGITTVFHAATWSWEPGLRSGDNAQPLLDAIEALRPQLAADTRFHLRHETYNLDAEPRSREWLAEGRIDLFAFNDHMDPRLPIWPSRGSAARMVERTGLSDRRIRRSWSSASWRAPTTCRHRSRGWPRPRARPTSACSRMTTTRRRCGRHSARRASASPNSRSTKRPRARRPSAGDFIVFGAPNVVRGGSHTGWTRAADMIAKGLCSMLASDYYYPAPLLAAFRLAADGVLPLPKAWDLISAAPARAAGLGDRGDLAAGQRADIILVDDQARCGRASSRSSPPAASFI